MRLVQSKYRVEPRGSSPPLCLYIVSSFAVCNDVIDFSISHQVEFMAEDEMVGIVPNMNMEPLNFIAVISPQLYRILKPGGEFFS